MLTQRQLFLKHVAQTSETPLMLEIVKAEGVTLTDINGKKYIDLIAGISVSNIGHCHPEVVKAVKEQAEKYMHLMVYGEYIQSPQVKLATLLATIVPEHDSCFFVNSGTEAIEGSLKLARRFTGRKKIIAFRNAYHGTTMGALSLMDNEYFTKGYHPLLPGVEFLNFNDFDDLNKIDTSTACVVVEFIRGEVGGEVASFDFAKKLRERCNKTGALLIADEIQTGFGRTGKLFSFMHYSLQPDIIAIAKAMGGGMPIGAFMASKNLMQSFANPALGHLTTFGGHPVSCAASYASLQIILQMDLEREVAMKEKLIRSALVHPLIKSIDGKGLLLAIDFGNENINQMIIQKCLAKGIITDWFLFAPHKMRIAPPLNIKEQELSDACKIIVQCADECNAGMK